MPLRNSLPRWRSRFSPESLLPILLSFSVVTWGLAIPLYSALHVNKLFLRLESPGLLLIGLVFHVLPFLGLVAIDRFIALSSRAEWLRRIYWAIVFVAFLTLLARETHLYFLKEQTYSLPTSVKAALFVGALAVVVGLSSYAYRAVRLWFMYLAPAALVLAIVLLFQLGLFGATVSGSGGNGPLAETTSKEGPVVIMLFDGLNYDVLQNDGRVDEQRFPNFAALASESAWFTNATSNYATTLYSVPSLLTGELVRDNKAISLRLPVRDFESKNLLTLLSRQYQINVYQGYFDHCFTTIASVCRTLHVDSSVGYLGKATSFLLLRWVPSSLYKPLGIEGLNERLLPDTQDNFDAFLQDVEASRARDRVYYYHFNLPHSPYVYDETGNQPRDGHTEFTPGEDFSLVYENYRRQVAYTDSVLGRVISKLKSEGLYEDAVIVVTSDHGIRPDPAVMQTRFPDELSDLIPHIPLVIKAPGIPPQVNTVEYQHTDFVLTVLDVLGITGYENFSGVSAFSPERPVRDKVFYTKDVFRVDEAYTYDKDAGVCA